VIYPVGEGDIMSFRDFWTNVRMASKLRSPRHTVDLPRPDAATIEQTLRSADSWLTPKSVEGFDPGDFSFLSKKEHKHLVEQVSRFRKVVSKVQPDAPPTKDQLEEALPALVKIIELLDFHKYGDADAFCLGKQIEKLIQDRRPSMVAELRFKTGLDHAGDPGIWIWAILDDDGVSDEEFHKNANVVEKLLASASRSVAPERWPYFNVRGVSEQAEIVGTQAS
jgi:hypothetical protein